MNSVLDCKLVEKALKVRGLDKKDLLITDEFDDYMFINMKDAKEQFIQNIIYENKCVGVLIDVDVDGLSSGKIIIDYIMQLGVSCKYKVNEGKVHGLNDDVIDWVKLEGIEYLIVVDAGTNDKDYFEILKGLGVNLLILDHHEVDEDYLKSTNTSEVVIVNSSYDSSPNKYLSGAGVTYRFLNYVNKGLNLKNTDDYKIWVGLSVLSDSCNILDLENRGYVDYLYKNYTKNLFLSTFENYGSLEGMFNYEVIPLLNASFRMSSGDLAVKVAFSNNIKQVEKLKEKLKEVYENQKSLVNESLKDIKIINGKSISIGRVDEKYKNLTGLIANKLVNTYCKACIILREDEERYVGSFRGYGNFDTNILKELGVLSKGHLKASGVFLEREEFLGKVRSLIDIELDSSDINNFDLEINEFEYMNLYSDLYKIAYLNEYTGNGFNKIKVKISNIENPANIIRFDKGIHYRYRYFNVVGFKLDIDEKEEVYRRCVVVYPCLNGDSFTLVLE